MGRNPVISFQIVVGLFRIITYMSLELILLPREWEPAFLFGSSQECADRNRNSCDIRSAVLFVDRGLAALAGDLQGRIPKSSGRPGSPAGLL